MVDWPTNKNYASSIKIKHDDIVKDVPFGAVIDPDPSLPIKGVMVEPFHKTSPSGYSSYGYEISLAKKVLRRDPNEYLKKHQIDPSSEKGKKLIAASVALRMGVGSK
jgi:hypothetical protein